MATLEQAVDDVLDQMRSILLGKRAMRGPENIERQGVRGVLTRVREDKLARIDREIETRYLREALLARHVPQEQIDRWVPPMLTSEPLQDDLLDSANYIVIAILLERGLWSLPLEDERSPNRMGQVTEETRPIGRS